MAHHGQFDAALCGCSQDRLLVVVARESDDGVQAGGDALDLSFGQLFASVIAFVSVTPAALHRPDVT